MPPPQAMAGSDQTQGHKRKRFGKKKYRLDEATLEKLLQEKKAAAADKQNEAQKGDTDATERNVNGRPYTVSIALPGSIVDNAQSPELRTYLAGQIGRALAVFNVDEVVIFREEIKQEGATTTRPKNTDGDFEGAKNLSDSTLFLARVLQYLETPQYLRKSFFPVHKDLQYAGLLNPLDAPHHMRIDEDAMYREGVVLNRPVKGGKGSFVDCGMRKQVTIDKNLQPGLRVTVKLDQSRMGENVKMYRGKVVKPSLPREEGGIYWGYTVRVANTMADIFAESPYKDGYDLTLGTSERGEIVDKYEVPEFKHLLIVFGGLAGLEAALDADSSLNVAEARDLFDAYLNTCPQQGSRTIRTEEAILVTMAALRPKITAKSGTL